MAEKNSSVKIVFSSDATQVTKDLRVMGESSEQFSTKLVAVAKNAKSLDSSFAQAAKGFDAYGSKSNKYLTSLENQLANASMSAKDLAIQTAKLNSMKFGGSSADVAKAGELAAKIYDVKNASKEAAQESDNLANALKHVAHYGVGLIGIGMIQGVASSVITTTAEFQRLEAALVTVKGSTQAAEIAFDQIKDFAKTTPYELAEVTDAFIKMEALGLTASSEAMTAYGDTASGLGKSLNQMIEAVADASVGEFERLKEFGIKASSEGDKVKFTFKGVTTEVGKNTKEIEEYLIGLGQVNFAGGMERQMQTIGGQLSNLQDNWSSAFNAIGTVAMPVITTTIGGLNSAADAVRFMAENTDKLSAIAIPAMAAGLTVKAVPAIWSTSIALNAAAASAGGFTAAMIAAGRASMAFMATPLGAALTAAGAAAAYLAFRTDETAESVAQLTEKAKELNVQLSSKEAEQQAKKLIALQQELQGLMARKQSGAVDVFGAKENELRQRIADIQNLKQETSELKTQSEMLLLQERGMGTQLEMLNKQTRDFGVSVNDVNKLIWEQGAAVASVKKPMDEWDRAIDIISDDFKKLNEEAAQNLANPNKKSFDAAVDAQKEAKERSKKLYEEQKQAAKKAAEEILQAKKRAQDEAYDHFEKNLQAQEKAQQDYQKSVSDTFDSVRRELDPTIDLYEAYNKKVQAVTASTLAGSADQGAMLKKLQENLNKQLDELRNKNEGTADAVRVAWEQSIKRLDDAFANVWEDIFSGASDFGSSLKRWFTSLLAELAHAAITKPIVISMSGALGLGGSSAASANSMMSLAGIGDSLSSAVGWLTGSSQSAMLNAQTGSFGAEGAFLTDQALASAAGSSVQQLGLFGNLSAGAQSGLNFLGSGSFAGSNMATEALWNSGNYGAAIGNVGGTYLPIIGGAFYGYQKSGVQGAIGGAGGAYASAQLGTMILPGIGTAIGAALGAIGGEALMTGLFGGGWNTYAADANLNVSTSGANYATTKYENRDPGWFRSTQWRQSTDYNGQVSAEIGTAMRTISDSIRQSADVLGFDFNETFTAAFSTSVVGKSGDQVRNEINAWLGSVADSLIYSSGGMGAYIDTMRNSGESLSTAMDRIIKQFYDFNAPLLNLNESLSILNQSNVKAVNSLLKVAGGIESLVGLESQFADLFYSEAQKVEMLEKTVKLTFNALNTAIPRTRDDFTQLVSGLDLTVEKNQTLYVALLQNAQLMDVYYDTVEKTNSALSAIIQSQITSIQSLYNAYKDQSLTIEQGLLTVAGKSQEAINLQRTKELQTIDASLRPFQERLWLLQDEASALDKIKTAYNSAMSKLQGFTTSIKAFAASLLIGGSIATGSAYASDLVNARLGNESALGSITQSAQAYLEQAKNNARTLEDYNAIVARVSSELMALPDQLKPEQFIAQEIAKTSANEIATLQRLITETGKGVTYDQMAAALGGSNSYLRSIFDAIDANKDGTISALEAANASIAKTSANEIATLQRLITETGKGVTYDQMAAALGGSNSYLRSIFDAIDADKDGTISALEAVNASTTRVDSNTSGLISDAEKQLLSLGALNESTLKQASGQITLNNTMISLKDAVYALGVTQAEQLRIEQERIAKEKAEADRIRKIETLTKEGVGVKSTYETLKSTISNGISGIWNLASTYGLSLGDGRGGAASFNLTDSSFDAVYNEISGNPNNFKPFKDEFYQSGGVYYQTYGNSDAYEKSYRDLQAKRQAIIDLGGVPTFATGGLHSGGIRLVGENGPELEVTGASRIFNAQQTQAILKGSSNNNADVVAELKAVRGELAQSRKEQGRLLSMLNERTGKVVDNTEYLMVWDSSTLPPIAGAV